MANDANIFKNSLTAAGYVTPEKWSERIEQVAREKSIFRTMTPSIVVLDRVGSAGNTEYIQKNAALSAAAVTDGNSISVSSLSFTQVSVSASIVGVAVQISLKQLRDQLPTVRDDVIMNLGTAIAEKEESDIITELYTTGSAVIYADGVTSGTITSSNVFDVDLFNEGVVAMRVDKRKAANLIVHPNQEGDLRNDQKFLDASYFGNDMVNKEGLIGRYLGVNVYSSTNIGSATENSTTVYKALLLGERALVLMDKKRPTLEIDRVDIKDLSMTMQVYADYGVQLLNEESVRILKSA